ncbi:MAG: cytochrome c [Candidatus Kaistia colombiensis]|nr:MAG: cytochrome c [Kaistia sp.]
MTLRGLLWSVAVVVVCGALVVGGIFAGLFEKSVVSKDVDQPLTADQMKTLAERGAYVAVAADCYACHTAKDGAAWAGGLPFQTPFGTIYASNISPDKDKGIGNWTRAEFHRALRDGIGKGGKHLYPAMPYASYRKMTPEDVDAIYAYLMTREPMKVENRQNALAFPFNIRRLMTFWNLVNLQGEQPINDPAHSEVWNRGRYLADALAHCGECHTPRNLLQGMEQAKYLQGATIEGIAAPDITKAGLTQMGFDAPLLASFMKSGISAQGAMTNQMFDVVHFSTQYMSDGDLAALSAYLFDLDTAPDRSVAPAAPKPVSIDPALAVTARGTYLSLCSGCHGVEGQGIPHVVVPLATNASLRLNDARNLVHTVLHGLPAQRFPGLERMQPMPAFGDQLTDQQVADLTNWMRANWGGQEPNVKPEDIATIRAQ